MGRYVILVLTVAVSSQFVSQGWGQEPSGGPEGLRYDGKPFEYWHHYMRTELKSERRVEAIRALAAFGVRAAYTRGSRSDCGGDQGIRSRCLLVEGRGEGLDPRTKSNYRGKKSLFQDGARRFRCPGSE